MDMEVHNENIQYDHPFMHVRVFESSRENTEFIHWHFHKEIEFLAVLDGGLEVSVDDGIHLLKRGDLLLIGSSQLHRDRAIHELGKLHYVVFQFDIQNYLEQSSLPYYRYFADPAVPLSRLNYIFEDNEAIKSAVYNSVIEIFDENRNKNEGYEIAVSMLIQKIILTLLRGDTRKMLHQRESSEFIRLKPVIDYINANLTGRVQVEEASRVANISYYYFVKYFKKVFGMSFLDYVNYHRIKRAERILLTKDISVSQVGEEIGMPNMAHFYKIFKKYNGCSPNEYRKKMLEWKT
jgi:AraC-like DNA-binding protein/mannose-6-phosphate isomerase-like protein (cupin superfamily)